ncbi:exodeoxyribonuclease III [Microcoleus sp. FACHB-672]|uniref:exodeoxyribonuclease III n=1 Tax=Microcoleus sp. FACHB-672 TaxID=2692825 RepID=UPI001684EE27|nr:exodeoxyribonuclease III [Microcoleus sp. FACHB-672]MBD2039457.1 exodeoxyribonuclease III [Microcoleus sp. FACHB-672]
MKIATWNVNSIRSRLEQVIAWLQVSDVDVLCLQETKVVDTDFPRTDFENIGYHVYIYGQKSYNGVAIFSRQPMEDVSMGFVPVLGTEVGDLDEQKRLIVGTLNGVRIVNVYVPNGSEVGSDKYLYKLSWLKLLREYLKRVIDNNNQLCICGDFNIALEDRDIHNPKAFKNQIMASDLERQALRAVLELGLGDAFRKFTEETGHFSWWDYRSGGFARNRGWRIDHLYLTPTLYEQSVSCTIDTAPRKLVKPSDHTPVIVEI